MKTLFIITVGSRDVQLLPNFVNECIINEDFGNTYESDGLLQLTSPRKQGKIILKNFEIFKDFIKIPIIEPEIRYIFSGVDYIEKIYLFTTNQPDADERFNTKDTLFSGEIIAKYIEYKYPNAVKQFNQVKISGNLTYYDDMYDTITEKINSLKINVDNFKVYLLAQGGIDAINTALLLKSIEKFPNFYQFHKPEDKEEATILSFPDKFRTNINKQIIINAIKNYNYSLIIENFQTYNASLTALCNYAHSKLNLDYKSAFNFSEKLFNIGIIQKGFISHILQKGVNSENKQKDKQKDLYISAKIKLKQLHYGDFLMKIFTLSENILKPRIRQMGFNITFNENTRHKSWIESFERIDSIEEKKLSVFLENSKLKKGGLRFDSPNKYTFYGIIEYFSQKEEENKELKMIFNICQSVFVLAELRNTVAHELENVSKDKIEIELKTKTKISLDDFISKLDFFYRLKNRNDFGIYGEINKKIISLL